jgi:zinc transporter
MAKTDTSPGILHACVLDGKGGARMLAPPDIARWTPADGVLWLHIDFTKDGTYDWLQAGLPVTLPDVVLEVLTDLETRPRAVIVDNGLLVALRGVNMNPGENPADMVSIRVWLAQDYIITSRRRRLLAVNDILADLHKGEGPQTPGDFLSHLVGRLADGIAVYVDKIEDHVIAAEGAIADGDNSEPRRLELSRIRRQIANVRRFVAPQRDALEKVHRYPAAWMPQDEIRQLREEADRIARYVEDLDLARERAILLHEEFQGIIAQQQNSRMYVLSMVAAIFLPLTFVTGLLGMNVGGLPGVDNKFGFLWAIIAMSTCVILAALVLRLKKWM